MAKLLATARMPRGVLNRYQTRMLTAEGTVFDIRSRRWHDYFVRHGWATPAAETAGGAPAEPVAAPARRRGRPPLATRESVLAEKTVGELRQIAEEKGVELPGGYVRHDELIEAIEKVGDKPADTAAQPAKPAD